MVVAGAEKTETGRSAEMELGLSRLRVNKHGEG
jgi:hypothetical protein